MILFPKQKTPYFICSPPWTHTSSGVRTLHLLCHLLNEAGEKAYLVFPDSNPVVNPFLDTPILFPEHRDFYGDDFIAVYPDIIRGNPLSAKHTVRYLLAPRGAYGGDEVFPDTDQIWGALPSLAGNVLRIPVSDPNIFFDKEQHRYGNCFYSHKYEMHGNKLLPITENSLRLEGSLEQLAGILRNSERCYLYELSSVITEAALCRCPVTLIRTPYFNTIDSSCMMGDVRWSDGEAVKKCNYYLPEYQQIVDDVPHQIEHFIKKTQELLK